MNYGIYAPSYKRGHLCRTHKYLPEVTYVVRESEAEDYDGVHDRIWIVPDSAQGNLCRIRNYILDNAAEDNIVLLDDDIHYFGRWSGTKKIRLTGE